MDDHSYEVNKSDEDSKYKEFLEMTRAQLVDFLSARGQSVSGGKMSLAALAYKAWENGNPLKLTTQKHQDNLQQEYATILSDNGITDPLQLPAEQWSKDAIDKWPLVDMGKIFSYILKSSDFTADFVGKYKTQKAYSYFASKFVGPLWWTQLPHKDDFSFITGEVTPSQSVRGECHKPWLYI
ncbi:YqaJ viral recombinase domain [Elysia marginata]|uniref:YqaJ viral recombinase domain n=1 Tax=Elysia marginata TaxID=1093978 RepID=A0AAV4I5U5_9GAST|nr:YqaJ viral recombinase domain [Elysia marginata]